MLESMTEERVYQLASYVLPFLLFTMIGWFLVGPRAVKWSDALVKSVRTNILLTLANGLITPVFLLLVFAAQSGFDALNIPTLPDRFWDAYPMLIGAIAFVVVIDFCDYWNHRLLHMPGFWDIHAVHHSELELNWTTTNRAHVLEGVVMHISYILIAGWMNLPFEDLALVVFLRVLHGNWVHTKYDVHLGPLTKVIATPRFHHWHHADTPDAYNTNFANTFAFWDVLFGTYRVPGPYRGVYGFEGGPGNDIFKLIFWPYLQWARVLARLNKNRTKA